MQFLWRVPNRSAAPVDICPVKVLLRHVRQVVHTSRRAFPLWSLSTFLSGRYHVAQRYRPRGTMTLWPNGLVCSQNHEIVVCPASCKAMALLTGSHHFGLLFPNRQWSCLRHPGSLVFNGLFLSCRAAYQRCLVAYVRNVEAPEKPGVWRASKSISTELLSSQVSDELWKYLYACSTGKSTFIWRSKRPARNNAWSSMSTMVGGCRDDDTTVGAESVHLGEQRIERIFHARRFLPLTGFYCGHDRWHQSHQWRWCLSLSFALWMCRGHGLHLHRQTSQRNLEPLIEKNGTRLRRPQLSANRVLPVPEDQRAAPFGIFPPKSVFFVDSSEIPQSLCISVWHQLVRHIFECDTNFGSFLIHLFVLPTLNTPPPLPPPPQRRNQKTMTIISGWMAIDWWVSWQCHCLSLFS